MKDKYWESYRKLGLNITYYRRDRGYTQAQLAELIDLDMNHVQKIENANAGASLDTIFALAEALNVPVHRLFEFRD